MHVESPTINFEFLLVSNESSAQEAVHEALSAVGGTVESATSIEAARDLVTTHKVDGVILDVDIKSALDQAGHARRVGRRERGRPSIRRSTIRELPGGSGHRDAEEAVALKGGANALLTKPLSIESVSATVRSFKSIMASERRRYQRHDVTLPVVVGLSENTYQGIIENISQGGMAVRLPCLLPEASVLEFSFELDGGIAIEGNAHLRWSNPHGLAGMEFRSLPPQSRNGLMSWLRDKAAAAVTTEQV